MNENFNVLSKDKWRLHTQQLETALEGKFYDILPVNIHLSPSLKCNFSCPHCTYGGSKIDYYDRLGRGENVSCEKVQMSRRTMNLALDRMKEANIQRVIFTGGGEPLINPHTVWGLKYSKRIGLNAGLFTNGYLLDKKRVERILEASPSFVRISLNAGSSKIHRIFHGLKKGCFLKIKENITYLAKQRQRRNSPTEVSIGVIISPLNFDETFKIAEIVSDIYDMPPIGGINYLNYRPTINYAGHRKQLNDIAIEGINYVAKKYPELAAAYKKYFYSSSQFPQEIFDEARELTEQASKMLEGRVSINLPNHKFLCLSKKQLPFKKCLAFPWVTKVGPDGSVYLCVEHGLEEKYCIGNITQQTFPEIIRGEKRKNVIERINNSRCLDDICGPGCMLYDLNMALSKIEGSNSSERDSFRKESISYKMAALNLIQEGKLPKDYLYSM